jgi:hypothetical protein
VKEETSAPHSRLVCNHLHASSVNLIVVNFQSNSTAHSVKKKKQKTMKKCVAMSRRHPRESHRDSRALARQCS